MVYFTVMDCQEVAGLASKLGAKNKATEPGKAQPGKMGPSGKGSGAGGATGGWGNSLMDFLRRNRRWLWILAALIVLLVIIGVIWQTVTANAEASRNRAPGKLVEVSGIGSGKDAAKPHKMHLYCTGQGSPTVILEAGVPEWSLHWRPVQEGVARYTRVCSYDRAGYGWSEPGPKPRSAEQIVGELHALLAGAGEKGPFVLAAHSFWGPAALLYQHDYPAEVAGIVLVESWSPRMFSPTPTAIQQSLSVTDGLGKMAPYGLVRMLDNMNLLPLDAILRTDLLPADLRPALKSAALGADLWNTMGNEYRAMATDAEQFKALGQLGALPLVVIRAGKHEPGFYVLEPAWEQAQQELAGLSTDSQIIVAADSGHNVQLQQPDLVVKAIQDIVDKVKK